MKICIIDDEWICRFLTQKVIRKLMPDAEIIIFENGLEAFEYMKLSEQAVSQLPELILLDINMPVASGWEFLDMMLGLQIKDYNPVVYIVSSSTDAGDLARSHSYASVQGYLDKPLTAAMLAPVLLAVLFHYAH